jgi:uncharacterized protein (TIGR03067 family)
MPKACGTGGGLPAWLCVLSRRFAVKVRMLSVLAALLFAAGVPAEESVKNEQDKLQGTWSILQAEHDGHKTPAEKLKSTKLVIAGDKMKVHGEKGMESQIKIDPSKKPKAIDIIPADGPDKGMVLQGIYELDGNELKICLSKPGRDRPAEFVSKENSGTVLLMLGREK